ncbi:MAG: HipA domain-containing protein [Chlorobiaceae bacterium]|nr:HipA domain-containing protein [Chlorobiaceae bacterium]
MDPHCLFCYKPLQQGELDYHSQCSRKMFGSATPPVLLFDEDQYEKLASGMITRRVTVPGVQPKLCLDPMPEERGSKKQRFSIDGLRAWYILKPPEPKFPQLPEIEDLTMHMAEAARIAVVPHCLIRMQSGSLAYLTRRIDRGKSGNRHMEDMCQIIGHLTENKYRGSYEQIAKTIRSYSANPGLDVINFFDVVFFCFLTGNADMHLKNFSLIEIPEKGGFNLAPAYDLLSTALVMPSDDEDLALTLNGKKKRITLRDFRTALDVSSVDKVVQERMFSKFRKALPLWEKLIERSFLDIVMQTAYRELIMKKFRQIRLDS